MDFTIENDHIKGELGFGEIAVSPDETSGYRPYELFVSSLAGYSGNMLRTMLTKRRVSFEKIQMESSTVRNPDEANRIEQLSFFGPCVYSGFFYRGAGREDRPFSGEKLRYVPVNPSVN